MTTEVFVLTHTDKNMDTTLIGVCLSRAAAETMLDEVAADRHLPSFSLFITPCLINQVIPA